jgi:DNA-directed RNA polymerase subunit M/transcription elongation factor TFIIS
MKLLDLTCPHCGAPLKAADDTRVAKCPYCDSNIYLDDEAARVRLDGAESAGYDFEMGRIRAQQEAETARREAQQKAARKHQNMVWWVLGWIFIFAVPATILIVRSKKLPVWAKVLLTALVWLFYFGVVYTNR